MSSTATKAIKSAPHPAPMKIAVLSDVHGNLPALQTTMEEVDRWNPDLTVVNGDVVNRGPRSRACWDLVRRRQRSHGWRLLGGNHEAYVGRWVTGKPDRNGPRFEIDRSSFWTYRQLQDQASALLDLPQQIECCGPDGSSVRLTHGTMRGVRDGIYAQTGDRALREKIRPAPDVFCTAHTHKPLVRRLGGSVVVNCGSAGTSFDGDPRISYARLTWSGKEWHAEIVRLPYDRQTAAGDFGASGYLIEGGPLVEIFFQEWLLAQPLVNRWSAAYEEAVIAGETDLATSVHDFLDETLGSGWAESMP